MWSMYNLYLMRNRGNVKNDLFSGRIYSFLFLTFFYVGDRIR